MATKCCRNLIIDDILNIVPISDRCPAIIQTVADIADAVDGTVVGQLTVERYIDVSENQHIHLWEWDGAQWVEWIDTSFKPVSGLFDEMVVNVLDNGWQVSLDQGATWNSDPVNVAIDPPSATVDVWFRNSVNNCVYSNLPEIPLQDYCTDWVAIQIPEPAFFSILGTVNGVTPPDQAGILATMVSPYQGVQGAFGGVYYTGGEFLYLQVSRPSDQPVTASLATVLDENGLPLSAAPTNTSCGTECYQTNFTPVSDLSFIAIESIVINGVRFNIIDFTTIFFLDVGAGSQLISALQTYFGIYDPSMTMSFYQSGGSIYLLASTMLEITEVVWGSTIDFDDDGTAIVTTCI